MILGFKSSYNGYKEHEVVIDSRPSYHASNPMYLDQFILLQNITVICMLVFMAVYQLISHAIIDKFETMSSHFN
jgi:hypothetical protein